MSQEPITIFPTFSRLNGDPEYLAWKSLVKKIKSRSWRNGENHRAKEQTSNSIIKQQTKIDLQN